MSYYQLVWDLVRRIPPGRAATYGQIALMTGSPRAARVVGSAMAACRDPSVPCHRVMGKGGALREAAFAPGPAPPLLRGGKEP